ncbi:MAG: hypothetical protein IJM43_03040 [Bacteroidaceae bacterium]|nr:hypothetical protein [Bacteroidaceae bacterium]
MESKSSFDYLVFSPEPIPTNLKAKEANWNLVYLFKGTIKCDKKDGSTSIGDGEITLFPPMPLNSYISIENYKSDEAEGICLTIYPSFMERLSANFPEFADTIRHIHTIKQPLTYSSTKKKQILKELKEMGEVSNAERIPHLLNILCWL